ncbi:predicted protein, partial [Nematostella vectensis]
HTCIMVHMFSFAMPFANTHVIWYTCSHSLCQLLTHVYYGTHVLIRYAIC